MSIVPAQTLRLIRPVDPFFERTKHEGMTYGLGPAGYDVRIAETVVLDPALGVDLTLASTVERFWMPTDLLGIVHDKSTWARLGLAVQNTVIEPGWRGFLTLELTNHGEHVLVIKAGMPIAQIIFHRLEAPTDSPYPETGKYQEQRSGPQSPIFENRSEQTMTFDQWMMQVNAEITKRGIRDVYPAESYRPFFEAGLSAQEAVRVRHPED